MRAAVGDQARLPLRHQLLPDRDALPALRPRGHLLPPDRGPAARVRRVRARRADRLRRAAARRLRLRLAARSARMAVTRQPLSGAGDFRSRQLLARDLLRGDLDGLELERYVEQSILTTTVERAVHWARSNALFPATFGLACCAIEMMSIVAARVDVARFGFEAFRASPRQADLLILSGRVSVKMAPVIRRIYDQMLEPKWAISMGACCSSMGVFNNYALVPSDKFMPIDVHVPGCPPRPEALMHGILRLRDKIHGHEVENWRDRYEARGTEEIVPYNPADGGAVNVFAPGDTAGA